ncbi:P-loop containing nucleoside triphosphate hydrolase protein [Polyplosphaeria fusca]|uniref:P-loop containing nucleoside triphosphate hydrolase protein n=1 Tax=Polyplosphaeria fusca TaxID=682080 RepID=A0A9P4V1D6_9PLEO|nr:P-loop containing nucleoside triphosphate hydrolase protein [Polyplosphaeria fusca]
MPTPTLRYFVLLLPSHIWGFHMQNKSWRPLLVSNITDVTWDQNVFNTLVLPNDTKDLVMALIMNKIDTEQSTDFVHEKGTGLVILFHGPPGTGKTMTAESVAELARKPLYRVTCGDIGTKPEDVERYLKRVLWLGKTWDCVVLLDEAEVFLQERALNDVQRNALVSTKRLVFLRTLEYYDGILVLTSNRVGTFDEGFKSRIQLALHYENLTHSSRERVWENFINRLESFRADDIDVGDLRLHIKDLADYKMNGRQIRNAVTTGRQLAMFKKKPLDFNGMKHVIKVSGRFDDYLRSVNEGMEDEDIAREDRVR